MTIGKPLPSRRVKIVDPSTLEPVPEGETGELLVTADHTVKEYLNKPDETAAALFRWMETSTIVLATLSVPERMGRSAMWNDLRTFST